MTKSFFKIKRIPKGYRRLKTYEIIPPGGRVCYRVIHVGKTYSNLNNWMELFWNIGKTVTEAINSGGFETDDVFIAKK